MDADVIGNVRWAVDQYKSGNSAAFVAAAITLAVKFGRPVVDKVVPEKFLPFVSSGLGVLLSVTSNMAALAIGAQPLDWATAIGQGVFVGAAANGFWSQGAKFLFEKATEKPALAVVPPVAEKPAEPAAPAEEPKP